MREWKNSELLVGLSLDDLKTIESSSISRSFPKDEYIIRDGEDGKSLFIIVDGEVAIIKNGMLLAEKTSGNHFGFMAVIDDSPRSADVKALSDLNVIEIDIEQIKLHGNKYLFQSILANHFIIVQKRLRKMNEITASEMQDRLQMTKEIKSIRSELSSDLHDDVGSILAGIAMQSELISNTMERTDQHSNVNKHYLDNICSLSREAMENMRDIVWAIDSSHLKYENLIGRMQDYASSTFNHTDIRYSFFIEGLSNKDSMNQELKQNLYLIFKEAITNIIKHAMCTKVEISLIKIENQLSFIINDNGSSQIQKNDSGMGLRNMKYRASKINATIEFIQNKGFEVRLHVAV